MSKLPPFVPIDLVAALEPVMPIPRLSGDMIDGNICSVLETGGCNEGVRIKRCCDRRAASGFTLVEVLVVIGIAAVLAALLLPAFGKARNRADSVVALSNLRQIMVGLRLYANDNNGYLPSRTFPGKDASGNEQKFVDECLIFVPLVQQGYIEDTKLFINPLNARLSFPLGKNIFGMGKNCYFGSNTYVCAEYWVRGDGFPPTAEKISDDGGVPVVWDQRADGFSELNRVTGPKGLPAGHFAYLDGSVKLIEVPSSLLKTGNNL